MSLSAFAAYHVYLAVSPLYLIPEMEQQVSLKLGDCTAVNLIALHAQSPPGELIYGYGKILGEVTDNFGRIHSYVTWLRAQEIRLDRDDLMDDVRCILATAFPDSKQDAIDRYARGLRSLLTCVELPARFNVTNAVHVPCYNFGDLVDGQFFVQDKKTWFAGVVVGTRHASQKLAYNVFWLGQSPKKGGNSKNPVWMSVHSLRPHIQETAIFGIEEEWLNIEQIRTTYDPKTVAEVYVETAAPLAPSTQKATEPAASPALLMEKESVPTRKSSRKKQQPPSDSSSEDEDSPPTRRPRNPPQKPGNPVTPTAPPPLKRVSTQSSQNSLQIADGVKFAIDCLESLDKGDPEHPATYASLVRWIESSAATLASIYNNDSYITLVSETLTELETYPGADHPKLPHPKAFLALLAKHGFCVTPRMYSKCEILCIGIAMLDTKHHYVRIQQKAGTKKVETDGFRGMALLDPRVNRVMYNRLKRYGFANPRFHPMDLHPFSSVVINGGGSWLQSSDWEFTPQSRFLLDSEAKPFAFVVSNTPGVLEANGLYVASKSRRNGHPVYVQVSAIEFSGPPVTRTKKVKDFVPFRKCLQPSAVQQLQPFALDSQGDRLEACSPRVLFCTEGSNWGIQLLPSFETAMYLVQFKWKAYEGVTCDATCFKRPLYDGKQCNSTQKCSITISNPFDAASCINEGAKTHYFSFGTKRYALRNATEECAVVPGPLLSQGIHGDGPDFYNTSVYTALGDIKPTALSCAEEKRRYDEWVRKQDSRGTSTVVSDADHLNANPWCPFKPNLLRPFLEDQIDILEESWSALGAVFSKTYIETPAFIQSTPVPKNHPVLRVSIPLGCMAPFTYFWKHRGKGDEVKEQDKNKVPPIHLRPHDYLFSGDPRKHPTFDTEATLEFTGLCSNTACHSDPGSGLQVMECLQTFTPETANGHQEILPVYHEYFHRQDELDAYVAFARQLQCEEKETLCAPVRDVCSWNIGLAETAENEKTAVRVRVVGKDNNDGQTCSFDVICADFDSDIPVFCCRDGTKINLFGPPDSDFKIIADTEAVRQLPLVFQDSVFLELVKSAIGTTHTNWCSASLHELLCLLNTQVLKDATLSINANNIIEARNGDTPGSYRHSLLPSYIKLGYNQMRLYTSRGLGTRFVIPDPPRLTTWCFAALKSDVSIMGLGFCAFGNIENHPSKASELPWYTTEIANFESQGVVTTINGNAYRLVGEHCLNDATDQELPIIMSNVVQAWSVEGVDSQTLQSLSEYYATCPRRRTNSQP